VDHWRLIAMTVWISCGPGECTGSRDFQDSTAHETRGSTALSNTDSVVTASLETRPEARAGESVLFVIRLRNESPNRVDLYLRGREIAFDLVLTDSDGHETWSRLHDQVVEAILRIEQLDPGQSIELRHTWNQQDNMGKAVRPGEYNVRGIVPTDSSPIRTPPRRIRLLP
jgi:hypothetical protein